MRPKRPKFTDHTDPDSYYNLNRYYNEAEKVFDRLERYFHPPEIEECAKCRDCGRTVHDYHIPDKIWNDVIGSPQGVWCYDCFCERASKKGYVAVFACELIHPKKSEFTNKGEEDV